MKVRFSRGALRDLDEIFAYIASDNPMAAAELVTRIEHVAELIGENPEMGQKTSRENFRRFPVGEYLVVYEIISGEVVVEYVRHGARRRPWEEGQ
jgi:toxin ParE1/3/4